MTTSYDEIAEPLLYPGNIFQHHLLKTLVIRL